ncbi:MAG: hypothetical protein NZ805_03090 [Armatimonadetes bacterium]|nr:hypothetical protein [Armatimonadota bacterium]MDW8027871.1 hypothetical protein [Armatimonadota bacterium]
MVQSWHVDKFCVMLWSVVLHEQRGGEFGNLPLLMSVRHPKFRKGGCP